MLHEYENISKIWRSSHQIPHGSILNWKNNEVAAWKSNTVPKGFYRKRNPLKEKHLVSIAMQNVQAKQVELCISIYCCSELILDETQLPDASGRNAILHVCVLWTRIEKMYHTFSLWLQVPRNRCIHRFKYNSRAIWFDFQEIFL